LTCNLEVIPKPLLRPFEEEGKGMMVAHAVCGVADRFQVLGTLADYSMIGESKNISVNTLLINGYKEVPGDALVRPFWREVRSVFVVSRFIDQLCSVYS
jgi:hypothetical protein